MNSNLLTVEQMAEILKIKKNTIHNRKWQRRVGCPLIKRGKRLYSLAEKFWEWFNQGSIIFKDNLVNAEAGVLKKNQED